MRFKKKCTISASHYNFTFDKNDTDKIKMARESKEI